MTGCRYRTKADPLADVRQDIAATGRLPLADQQVDFPAQIHLRQGLFCAVTVAIDEVAHRHLMSAISSLKALILRRISLILLSMAC